MLYALILLLFIEPLLQGFWYARYFSFGIPVFDQRIAAPVEARARLTLNSLERDMASDTGSQLLFHPLPDGSVGFRESFAVSVVRRYYPVMRGQVIVDARRREVRVLGLCNWTPLVIALTVLLMAFLRPGTAPALLLLPLFLVSYLIQRRRFFGVVEVLRGQMAADRSVASLMAERTRIQHSR